MTDHTRRYFIQTGSVALLTATTKADLLQASPNGGAGQTLSSPAFQPLRLGEIRPAGWLFRQLRIQANGLGGHLDEFWPDVGPQSGWLGGAGESWERGPYFVDGLLPLAVQLQDAVLLAKAKRFVEWTLTHQAPSGMIGPATNDDWWPRMVMVKVLAQYHDATSDPRVIDVLTRYFHYQLSALPARPLQDWGKYRWQDEVLIVEWLFDRTHDPALLQLASLLARQGYDWVAGFQNFKYTGVTTRAYLDTAAVGGNSADGMQTHGVNNGQALKTAAVRYRLFGDAAGERANFTRQLGALDRYHGQPNGMFSCDEHLAGTDPSHGSELCTVVETLFSLQVAFSAFGDAAIADRIEKIAFNALPATFDDRMWAHQYDQQANQVQVALNSKPWTTNGPESNLYGLEPNFGCCTANFHQGWPKFVSSLWMRSPDDGLVAVSYAPCDINTTLAGRNVQVRVETDYPFQQDVRIVLQPQSTASFPIRLRVPAWATGATITVNGKPVPIAPTPGTFALLHQQWHSGDTIHLHLPMVPATSRWFNNSVAFNRGPLVFSLDPGQGWVKLRDRGLTADWQVYPQKPWNYALRTDGKPEVVEDTVADIPFAAATPAVRLRVRGRRIDAWHAVDGVAGPVPSGAQSSTNAEEQLELIPYAAAKLRVTAFPELKELPSDQG